MLNSATISAKNMNYNKKIGNMHKIKRKYCLNAIIDKASEK